MVFMSCSELAPLQKRGSDDDMDNGTGDDSLPPPPGDLTTSVRYYVSPSYQQYHEHTHSQSYLERRDKEDEVSRVRKTKWPVAAIFVAFLASALVLVGTNAAVYTLYVELRMLRGLFLVLLMLFLICVNVKVWHRKRIDYRQILNLHKSAPMCSGCRSSDDEYSVISGVDMDERSASGRETALTQLTSLCGVLWISAVVVVMYSFELSAPLSLIRHTPFVLLLVYVVLLGMPFPVLYKSSRSWLSYRLWRVVAAPFYPVEFVDNWIADQLTSLPLVLLDVEYALCLMVKVEWMGSYLDYHHICLSPAMGIRQILQILPSWFRFAQCLRAYYDTREVSNLINAGKYFSTFPVVIVASMVAEAKWTYKEYHQLPVFFTWLMLAVVHAVYVFSWDVIMDWGLLRDQPANPLLRGRLLYRKWLYFCAVALDAMLRFAWTLKISLSVSVWFGSDMLLLVLAIGEVLRRFVWNFFRLEHEQLRRMEEREKDTVDRASSPATRNATDEIL